MCLLATTTTTTRLWLLIWMVNNIGVTLLNKAAFASVHFSYPYFLSAVHMLCNWAGAELLFWLNNNNGDSVVTQALGDLQRQSLTRQGRYCMWGFSIIFSLNIAIGNVSLQYVSVNFNQVR